MSVSHAEDLVEKLCALLKRFAHKGKLEELEGRGQLERRLFETYWIDVSWHLSNRYIRFHGVTEDDVDWKVDFDLLSFKVHRETYIDNMMLSLMEFIDWHRRESKKKALPTVISSTVQQPPPHIHDSPPGIRDADGREFHS